jgi:hypothetical protein
MPRLPSSGGDIAIELLCVHINLRLNGAGDGNRTHAICLGSRSSTIELHPPVPERKTQYSQAGILHHPRRVRLTDLSCDRSPDGSLHAFASGQSFQPLSAPLQRSIRFFHHPLPTTAPNNLAIILVCQTGQTLCWAYRVPNKQHELGRFRNFAGDIASACSHQASEHPITCQFWQSPIQQVTFGSFSFTTFISGSHTLTIQLSLAPHPGVTPEITSGPSRGMTYPKRWLHCQSAQHPTVTSDAPLLDYRGLNPGFCQSLAEPQNNCLSGLRRRTLRYCWFNNTFRPYDYSRTYLSVHFAVLRTNPPQWW